MPQTLVFYAMQRVVTRSWKGRDSFASSIYRVWERLLQECFPRGGIYRAHSADLATLGVAVFRAVHQDARNVFHGDANIRNECVYM